MEKNILYAKNRKDFRTWLIENYQKEKEVWLVFPKLSANEESVTYNDAVEEALCFSWIDGRAGTLDDKHSIRRFTPRRKGSSYSRPNIERLIWLDENNMLLPSVKEEVKELIKEEYIFPKDIIEEIKKDKETFENFNKFSDSYKRIRVDYINSARKRPDEYEKRLKNFLEKTKEGKIITGYGGIEKYYK